MTASMPQTPTSLRIALLCLDGDTQPRETIDEAVVKEYAERIQAGDKFPPVVVFFDGEHHWIADGFHRALAHQSAGLEDVAADIRPGTREDAIWFACSANRAHGLLRSSADKRRAVTMALASPQAQALSDRAIAEHCGVSNTFVGEVRRALQLSSVDSCPRRGKDGKVRATSAAKRSEAAKARVERRQESVVALPPAPPSSAPPQAAPLPPLVLSLFGPDPPGEAAAPCARRRRKMPLRRVLAAFLMLSPEERRAFRRQEKLHLKKARAQSQQEPGDHDHGA